MNENYIAHYGTKGMRWGVRRASVDTSTGSSNSTKRSNESYDYKGIKKNVDTASKYVDTGKKIKSNIDKKKNDGLIKNDLKNMSDKDLQKMVNRLNMEERYTQVMSSRYSNSGKDRVGKILDTAGTALAVGSSALSIMIAIKELQK